MIENFKLQLTCKSGMDYRGRDVNPYTNPCQ